MKHTITPTDEQAHKHIQAQAFFISRIMDISPDVIYIVNIQTGTTVYVNKMLLTELGYTAENIRLGQLEKNIRTLYHPEDLEKTQEFYRTISIADDELIVVLDVRVKSKNNSWLWF
jgi:PAS domain S-box-containing protein